MGHCAQTRIYYESRAGVERHLFKRGTREVESVQARALLTYRRIRRRYAYTDEMVKEYLRGLEAVSIMVRPNLVVVSRDPNDDVVLQ